MSEMSEELGQELERIISEALRNGTDLAVRCSLAMIAVAQVTEWVSNGSVQPSLAKGETKLLSQSLADTIGEYRKKMLDRVNKAAGN